MSEKEAILGIDISKDKFSAALLKGEKKSQVKEFANNFGSSRVVMTIE